jgi:ribosomal protein S18 acetylase RimI-like enzyme
VSASPASHIEAVRRSVAEGRFHALVVDDLTPDDLKAIGWSGGPGHIRSVGSYLARVPSGEIEYLVLRAPAGETVSKCCVDYVEHTGAGTLKQIATHDELQGLGLATRVIAVAEDRIRSRGLEWAVLGVEDDNARARALYEHLGYVTYGREHASWELEDDGNRSTYETDLEMMRKALR